MRDSWYSHSRVRCSSAARAEDGDGQDQPITELVVVDVSAPAAISDRRVTPVTGDIWDPSLLKSVVDNNTGAIFHLAAIVSGMAEADFDLGMRINVDATRTLLELCRASGNRPRIVFTSSVAVCGGELPPMLNDTTALNPQTSYRIEKAIGEFLAGRLYPQGICRRSIPQAADDHRAPGPSKRGGVIFRERHHP